MEVYIEQEVAYPKQNDKEKNEKKIADGFSENELTQTDKTQYRINQGNTKRTEKNNSGI